MKKIITLFFLLLFTFSHFTFSQITTSSTVKISGNVYNKQSGHKLSEEETNMLLEKYPGIVFERVYNKYGTLEKLLYDPKNILNGNAMLRNEKNQIKPGELFPEFVFNTIDRKKIASKNLRGSWVLLRFELFSKLIDHDKIISLEKQIEEFNLSNKLTAVIIFADTNSDITQNMKSIGSVFKLIPDGRNFQEMYNIIEFPTTILLNKDGIVYKYYFRNEKIDFNDLN